METALPTMGGPRRLDVAYADDMEPEDMKCRRLAALKEFGIRNPEYQKLIKVQLKVELKGATERKQASPWQLTRQGHGKQPVQRVVCQTKNSRWTTKSSLELLDAVTRFEKSDITAIGKEKWRIIAADLMQHSSGLPGNIMSLTECAKYCRIRYCNMLARRQARGSSYSLTDELREKLEKFSRLIRETRAFSRPLGRTSRKKFRAAIQKKSRMFRPASLQSNSRNCNLS